VELACGAIFFRSVIFQTSIFHRPVPYTSDSFYVVSLPTLTVGYNGHSVAIRRSNVRAQLIEGEGLSGRCIGPDVRLQIPQSRSRELNVITTHSFRYTAEWFALLVSIKYEATAHDN